MVVNRQLNFKVSVKLTDFKKPAEKLAIVDLTFVKTICIILKTTTMRSTNTFSILFWADQKNATNNEALVYVRFIVNQKRANISLKRRVPIKLWDAKKNRSKGSSVESRQLNQYINQVYTKLFQIYQDLKFQEKLITAKLIKFHFVGDNE